MASYRHRAYLELLAVAAIWGAASPIIKFTFQGIDPLPFLAYRFLIAGLISFVFFGKKLIQGKKFKYFKKNIALVALYGLLAVPVALGVLFFGLEKSTVLDLTLIGAVGPLMITAGGAIFYHERVTKREKRGIAIVMIGVLINSFFPLLSSGSSLRLTGNLFLLLYLISDSSAILIAKKIVRYKVKSSNLSNFAFILGAFTLVPLTIADYGLNGFITTITTLPLKYHLGVWYMALISGNLAYYFYIRAQKSIEVSEATLFMYLQPIFTIPLAIFWLKEKFTLSFLIGAAIIALGVYIAETKAKSNHTRKNKTNLV